MYQCYTPTTIIPPLHRRWNGAILDSPRCLSVRLSVCRQSFPNFLKKTVGSIHFIPNIYPYGVSLLVPTYFRVLASFLAFWWRNIWSKIRVPELFEKTIGPIHFITGIYPYGLSLWTPIHFRVPSPIFGHFITGIYPYGLSLWTPIHFRVPSPIFGRKWGFRNFLKKLLAQFILYLAFTLMGWVSWTLSILVFLASFSALW